jgi:hypothetical protein
MSPPKNLRSNPSSGCSTQSGTPKTRKEPCSLNQAFGNHKECNAVKLLKASCFVPPLKCISWWIWGYKLNKSDWVGGGGSTYRFSQGNKDSTKAWDGSSQGLEHHSGCSMHMPVLHLYKIQRTQLIIYLYSSLTYWTQNKHTRWKRKGIIFLGLEIFVRS